ncbi:hypothetical protein MAN_07640, partial [Metarhizium hybridum]
MGNVRVEEIKPVANLVHGGYAHVPNRARAPGDIGGIDNAAIRLSFGGLGYSNEDVAALRTYVVGTENTQPVKYISEAPTALRYSSE